MKNKSTVKLFSDMGKAICLKPFEQIGVPSYTGIKDFYNIFFRTKGTMEEMILTVKGSDSIEKVKLEIEQIKTLWKVAGA